jgi:hypothetical protein
MAAHRDRALDPTHRGSRWSGGALSRHIAVVLKRPGSDVVSIAPDRAIAEAVNLLAGPAP